LLRKQTYSPLKCLPLASQITEPISPWSNLAVKFTCKSPKDRCVLQCSQGGEIIFLWLDFSWSWSGKMGKMKKDTNARVAGQTKQTKESTVEQMCMDNIPMDLIESDMSLVSDST